MKYQILLIIIILNGAIGLTSCEKDSHDPDLQLSGDITEYIPSYSFELDCNHYIVGDYLVLGGDPTIHINLNYWGLYIESIDYYFDKKFIQRSSVDPYNLSYATSSWNYGSHIIDAEITISGNSIKTIKYPVHKIINIIK